MGYGYGRTTSHNESAYERLTGKRAKRVFSNAMLAHVWAQRTQNFGQSNNGNFYFQGDSLFSYGSHFLVAFLLDIGEPEPVALINDDSRSVSTSGHTSDARRATSHLRQYYLPELTALADALRQMNQNRESCQPNGEGTRAIVKKWLGSFDIYDSQEIQAAWGSYTREGNREGAAIVAKAAGLTSRDINRIQAERARAVAKAREDDKARDKRLTLREAERAAAMSDSDFRAVWPDDGTKQWESGDGAKPYQLQRGLRLSADLLRWQKAAKARGWKKRAARLAAMRKAYRAHLAGRNDRIRQAWRDEKAKEIRAWRKGGARPRWFKSVLEGIAPATCRAMVKQEREEREAEHAAAFAAWQAGEGPRPYASGYSEGSPELAAILADEKAEQERDESAYLAWREDSSMPRPDKKNFLSGNDSKGNPLKPDSWQAPDGQTYSSYSIPAEHREAFRAAYPFAKAWEEIHTAERLEKEERERQEREKREAIARMAESEKREAWLSGESIHWHGDDGKGGALLRVRGDTLETSQGASVPLAHAVRTFQFIKLCKASGKAWARNGKTIRVGHFQVDSIDAAGNFKAGCHSFNWPEVERLAVALGVFDLEPSGEAVEVTSKESV